MSLQKRHLAIVIAGSALMAAAGLWGYGLFESGRIEISRVDGHRLVPGGSLDGMTAVQLSDLHVREMGTFEEEVLAAIRSIDPDIIFLTGDYVAWDGDYEAALAFLSKLSARVGVWAVLGDHDYSNSRKSCSFCHSREDRHTPRLPNVRFLRNGCETLQTPQGDMKVCGVDRQFPGTLPVIENELAATGGPVVLLSHSPLYFDRLNPDRDILVLAGDTHGGQVPVPSWLYGLLGYEKNARYNQGLFRDGRKAMYVSRGLGTSHVPIRVFRKPEIVVLKF